MNLSLMFLFVWDFGAFGGVDRSAAAGVADKNALVCMTEYIQVWGNGCRRYPLTQHWVNLRAVVEER